MQSQTEMNDGELGQKRYIGARHDDDGGDEKWIQVPHGGRLEVQRKGRSATIHIRQRSAIQGLSSSNADEEASVSPTMNSSWSGRESFSSKPEIDSKLDMHMSNSKRLRIMNTSSAAQKTSLPLSSTSISEVPEHWNSKVSANSTGQLSSLLASCLSSPINSIDEPSPLGLTLRKTPSLLNLVQMKVGETESDQSDSLREERRNKQRTNPIMEISQQEKPKAANFPAAVLKIGTWEWVSRYEGDLVVKCYYAKRRLVWEVLEKRLKNKFEISWSDITALKASCPDNEPGVLEIQVSRPPLFFKETNPQPRKHTFWQPTSDFTGGQANLCKWHYLKFRPGLLNRHYEKLIDSDPRLKILGEKIVIRSNPACLQRQTMKVEVQNEGDFQQPYSMMRHSSMQLQNYTNEHLSSLSSFGTLFDAMGFQAYNESSCKKDREGCACVESIAQSVHVSHTGENIPDTRRGALDVYSQQLFAEQSSPQVLHDRAVGGNFIPSVSQLNFLEVPLPNTMGGSASFVQPTSNCLQQCDEYVEGLTNKNVLGFIRPAKFLFQIL